jgi:hypothetical protein
MAKPVKSSFWPRECRKLAVLGSKITTLKRKVLHPNFLRGQILTLQDPFGGQLAAVSAAVAMAKPAKNTSKKPCAASKPHPASLGAGQQNQRF